jgi:hypothetical protein
LPPPNRAASEPPVSRLTRSTLHLACRDRRVHVGTRTGSNGTAKGGQAMCRRAIGARCM